MDAARHCIRFASRYRADWYVRLELACSSARLIFRGSITAVMCYMQWEFTITNFCKYLLGFQVTMHHASPPVVAFLNIPAPASTQ